MRRDKTAPTLSDSATINPAEHLVKLWRGNRRNSSIMTAWPRDGAVKKSKRRGRNAVTMHEVAEHAGASPMTVSRVISGDANVKPETRKRVDVAIKHFGYSPNVAARNLARAATVHIGLLYNNPSAAYMHELLVGVLEHSRKA